MLKCCTYSRVHVCCSAHSLQGHNGHAVASVLLLLLM